jgi:hypothetical protein
VDENRTSTLRDLTALPFLVPIAARRGQIQVRNINQGGLCHDKLVVSRRSKGRPPNGADESPFLSLVPSYVSNSMVACSGPLGLIHDPAQEIAQFSQLGQRYAINP